jgi:hypothetical protein
LSFGKPTAIGKYIVVGFPSGLVPVPTFTKFNFVPGVAGYSFPKLAVPHSVQVETEVLSVVVVIVNKGGVVGADVIVCGGVGVGVDVCGGVGVSIGVGLSPGGGGLGITVCVAVVVTVVVITFDVVSVSVLVRSVGAMSSGIGDELAAGSLAQATSNTRKRTTSSNTLSLTKATSFIVEHYRISFLTYFFNI